MNSHEQLECQTIIQLSLNKLGLRADQLGRFEPNENHLRKSMLVYQVLNKAKMDYYKSWVRNVYSNLCPKLLRLSQTLELKIARLSVRNELYHQLCDVKLLVDQALFNIYDFNVNYCVDEFVNYDVVQQVAAVANIAETSSLLMNDVVPKSFSIAQDHHVENNAPPVKATSHVQKRKGLKVINSNVSSSIGPKRNLEVVDKNEIDYVLPNFKRFRISS